MLTAKSEMVVADILPADYESFAQRVARQHRLELAEIYRTPNGLMVTLAAPWASDGYDAQFQSAITRAFTELQATLTPLASKKTVREGKKIAPIMMPDDLQKYEARSQPWYPSRKTASEELPTAQIPGVRKLIDVVLLTATEVEIAAVVHVLAPIEGKTALLRVHGHKASYYVGRMGSANVAVALSAMGSVGRDAALTTTTRAITTWQPKAVIMVGIAFGLKPDKQQIGDVLISEKITPYEPRRLGKKKIQRGTSSLAGKTLLARFKAIREWSFNRPDGSSCRKIPGELISGEKLVDDKFSRDDFVNRFPDAVGGEMEGAGLYAGASDAGVEWIVVKAICDWAMGKSSSHQELAAAAAVSLVSQVLQDSSALNGLDKAQVETAEYAPSPVRITNTNVSHASSQAAPVQDGLYRDRDYRTTLRLLRYLPLRFLSSFIESAHVDRIIHDVFYFWEDFNSEIVAQDFQLFDKELLQAVQDFHQAWGRSLGYGEYFLGTLDPNIYRYRSILPGESYSAFDKNHKDYRDSVVEVERSLRVLVDTVKSKFPEIDLHETSLEALRIHAEWLNRTESRLATTAAKPPNEQTQKRPQKTAHSKHNSKFKKSTENDAAIAPPMEKMQTSAKAKAKRVSKKSSPGSPAPSPKVQGENAKHKKRRNAGLQSKS